MNKLNYSKQSTAFCLELDRIKLLLKKIGNPDEALNIIHIAGTNGKGSVGSFIEAGLIGADIRCGRFQSPHLFEVEDAVTIDGEPIKRSSLKYYVNKLRPFADEVALECGKELSPFETLFAAVLLYFKKKKCSVVILECGMGGAGDATNAITGADIGVFATIDYDHTQYLGSVIAEIAENKCGIIRDGMRVYSAPQKAEAESVIVRICREKLCSLCIAGEYKLQSMSGLNSIVDIDGCRTKLSLAGIFQNINAALAARVLQSEFDISGDGIIYALTHAVNRARLEEIKKGLYFDGAHNPSGVRSLVDTINAADIKGKMIFAVGFMADKDISSCLDCLKNLNNKNFEIYAAKVHSNPRSASAEEIKKIADEKGFSAKCFDSISEAAKTARHNADRVFVFGSLYMYKELVNTSGELK